MNSLPVSKVEKTGDMGAKPLGGRAFPNLEVATKKGLLWVPVKYTCKGDGTGRKVSL